MSTIYTFNNKVLKNSDNNKWLIKKEGLPPIAANTIRVRTSDNNVPSKGINTSYETATLVAGTSDIYDVYKSGTSFEYILSNSTNVVEVLGANTSAITNMNYAFESCTSLSSVPLFDTSKVTRMSYMFFNCSSLTTVPLFDTSNLEYMTYMFRQCSSLTIIPLFNTSKLSNMTGAFQLCRNVQSGALALYQQASSKAHPPSHTDTFKDCGRDTVTGAAELAQIPSSWGGTGV
jgi:surface protein